MEVPLPEGLDANAAQALLVATTMSASGGDKEGLKRKGKKAERERIIKKKNVG